MLRGLLQVVIQLKRFAETVKKVRAAVSPAAASAVPPPAKAPRIKLLDADVSTALSTEITGMDASALGEPLTKCLSAKERCIGGSGCVWGWQVERPSLHQPALRPCLPVCKKS